MVSFMDVFSDLNTSTSGGFGVLLPAALFMVFFIGMKMFGNDDSFLASAFLVALFTVAFWRVGICSFGTMLFWIIATMVVGFVSFISR